MRCLRIVSGHIHQGHALGNICLCFVNHILTAADRYKDNEHKMQPFGLKDLVKTCKNAM